MTTRWLVLADDLTGAADCGIAFARRGIAAAVGWGARMADAAAAVFCYDADSRALPAAAAAERHRMLIGRLLPPQAHLFVKIDSTLRGQPAAAIAAALDAVRAQRGMAYGVLAPAFPATGRTTQQGHVHVDGQRLEHSALWQREHSYASADLPTVLASAGLRGVPIGLASIRGGGLHAALAAMGDAVAVCDATTEDDLQLIAAAAGSRAGAVCIGSAGLAHALATSMGDAPPAPLPLPPATGGALIVVGSRAAASRDAAQALTALPRLRHVPVDPGWLRAATPAERDALGRSIAATLAAGEDVLAELAATADAALDPALPAALAALLRPAARPMSGLAATGGETAAALLAAFGVDGIRLVQEIAPGLCLGLTQGTVTAPIVTKAGAFGDRHSLTLIAQRLRRIRQEGILA